MTIVPETLDQRFARAKQLHSASQFESAERIYREILAADPNHAAALHYLGILLHQTGRSAEAEQLMRASLRLRPQSAAFHNNLGDVLRALGKDSEALAAFHRAAQLDPGKFLPPLNIGMLLASRQRAADAIPWLRRTLELKADQPLAMFLLGQALLGWPESADEGITWLDKCLVLMPDHEMARFVRAAARGGSDAPATMPPAFVRGIFDGYAEDFDHHLVDELGYRGPQQLRDAVDRATGGMPKRIDILDLGCGTGLVAEVFRERAKSLAGVDVAPKMIAKAQTKDLYDELEVGELVPALQSRAGKLDLVLAGDVFNYVGDLADVFAATAAALRPGGLFAFTIEAHDGEGFQLKITRRFTHSHQYLRDLATRHGFVVVSSDDVVLRHEAQKDVRASVYVLRK